MQRYFSLNRENDIFLLSNDDSYHIKKVMRMKLFDQIEIVSNQKTFLCQIISLDDNVKAQIINEIDEYNEMNVKVIVVQSLVNEQKMDYILQKGTELGMYAFYPFQARNSVVKENNKSDKKIMRWQKIVKEASEQSKRNNIPKVNDIIDLNALCRLEGSVKLLLTTNELTMNIKKVLQDNKNCDTIIIVVGPEGGFTKLEEEKLIECGFISTSLGKRVLRTETASLAFLSMINYEWMV